MNLRRAVAGPFAFLVGFPLMGVEEIMKHYGVPISKHGITKNDNNESILDIWRIAEKEVETKMAEEKLVNDMLEANKPKAATATVGFVVPEGM